MKHIPNVAAVLLGVLFIAFGLNHWLHFIPMPESTPPEAAAKFFSALGSTGYLDFIKICEVVGGLLVLNPWTRNWGLLVLGPIVINILAVNIFLVGENAVFGPPVIAVSVLSAYVLWVERDKFLNLLGKCGNCFKSDSA